MKEKWKDSKYRDNASKKQKEIQNKQSTKDKRIDTMVSKYGVQNPMQIDSVKEKVANTNLEKYGALFLLCLQSVHDKSRETKLEKYGDENYNNPNKVKETKLEKYGDANYCNYDKIMSTKEERYGDPYFNNREQAIKTTINRYGSLYGPQISHPQKDVYENVLKKFPDAMLETYLDDVKLSVDIFVPSINKVIEVNGKYWHCWPGDWEPNEYHPHLNMKASDKWAIDDKRNNKIKDAGYALDIIWV